MLPRIDYSNCLAKRLVGWWTMDDWGPAINHSRYGFDGVRNGTITQEVVRGRRCSTWDGTSGNYFDVRPFITVPLDHEFTVMAWVTIPNTTDSERRYFWASDTTGEYPCGMEWRNDGGGSNIFQAWVHSSGDTNNPVNSSINPNANQWYHVAQVYRARINRHELWIDGQEDGFITLSGNNFAFSGLHIGTYRDANARWMEGSIADLRFYDRALSSAEMLKTYNETKDGSYGSLLRTRNFDVFTIRPQKSITKEVIRPDGDIIDGNWLTDAGGTDLWTAIDETTASDADYIESGNNPNFDTCEVTLSNPSTIDTYETSGHRVSYRYLKNGSGGRTIELQVRLLQGLTEIASWTHADISDVVTQADQCLTTDETSIISDWDDLRLEFRADTSGGGAGRRAQVTWAEVEARGQTAAAPAGAPSNLTLLGVGGPTT